ncbi:hypothetical protein Tco_0139940 [Tanacetum coccineum]
MAGEEPANMIARRVTDDLISFSGETTPPRFMKFFLVQKVAESHRFVNRMRGKATTARECVAQMTTLIVELQAMDDQEDVHDSLLAAKDAKRGDEAKLVALNDVIAEALDEIDTLENNVEFLDGFFTIFDWCSHLVDRLLYYAVSVEGCSTGRLQLGKVAESPRLPDKIKVAFDQDRKEETSFAALMCELCCSLRVSLSKKCRLAAELEGLGDQGDAVRALESMK